MKKSLLKENHFYLYEAEEFSNEKPSRRIMRLHRINENSITWARGFYRESEVIDGDVPDIIEEIQFSFDMQDMLSFGKECVRAMDGHMEDWLIDWLKENKNLNK